MPLADRPRLGRRAAIRLFRSALAVTALAGCARSSEWERLPTPALPTAEPAAERRLAEWRAEFEAIRAEAIPLLLAMADYRVYLPSVARRSALRTPDELMWDPPRDPSWPELQPHLRPLQARAAALYAETSRSTAFVADWRFRRALAQATHQLLLMAEQMLAYYEETSALAQGDDGGSTRGLLAAARRFWSDSEAAWQAAVAQRVQPPPAG